MNSAPAMNLASAIPASSAYFASTYRVAPGATQAIDATGNFVRCLRSSVETFKLSIDGAPSQLFYQGLRVKAPVGSKFSGLIIDNTAGTTPIVVTLAYGIGDVEDNSFVDNTQKSPSGYGVAAGLNAGGAGTFTNLQLWNPLGSGLILKVTQIVIASSVAQQVNCGFTSAQMGTASVKGQSKVSGQGQSNAQCFGEFAAGNGGHLLNGTAMQAPQLQAATSFSLTFTDALIVEPGFGFATYSQTANTTLTLECDFYEVAG